jgi:hypothetical protein
MKSRVLLVGIALAATALAADSGIDPSAESGTFYEFWASTSVQCTDPVLVFKNAAPMAEDVLTSPTLGSGPLADGTYPCVILVLSDTFSATPSASSDTGHCVAGTSFTYQVCSAGHTSLLPDGTTVNCTDGEDKIAVYFSTATVAGANGPTDPFHPPSTASAAVEGVPLGSPLVVNGDSVGTFYNDATGSIFDNTQSGKCDMHSTKVGFR